MRERLPEDVFDRFPRIESPRLVLRETTPADAEAVYRIFGDPEGMRYYNVAPFTSLDEAHVIIARWQRRFEDGQGFRWGITRRADGALVGTCGVNAWDRARFACLIGYDFAREHWGRGYATETVHALAGFAFGTLAVNRIEAHVMPGNEASVRVLGKVGFQAEGLLREHSYWRGAFQDLRLFSLLRREYAPTTPGP